MIATSSTTPLRLAACAAGMLIALPAVGLETIEVDDVPVFLLSGASSNLILTLDDSSSMNAAYLPDSVAVDDSDGTKVLNTKRAKSSCFNQAYYDPDISYLPPDKQNRVTFGDAPFSGAPVDPYASNCEPTSPGQFPAGCSTVDLATAYRAEWSFDTVWAPDPLDLVDADGNPLDLTQVYAAEEGPAYYYRFNAVGACTCAAPPEGAACPDESCTDEACYERVDVTAADADEKRNFANWYSYYRTRLLAAKTAISLVMHGLPSDVRIAYQGLNEKTPFGNIGRRLPLGQEFDPSAATAPAVAFDTATRSEFYSWLSSVEGDKANTPLVESTLLASESFRDLDMYREDPGDPSTDVYSCRRNMHVAFTDGGWSGQFYTIPSFQALYPVTARASFSRNWDKDGIAFPASDLPAGRAPILGTYPARPPFRDENTGVLADVVWYFWATDLCASATHDCGALDNNVSPLLTDTSLDVDGDGVEDDLNGDGTVDGDDKHWNPANDPASWQHVTSYFIGLGADGFRAFPEDHPLLFDQGFPGTNNLVDSPATATSMDDRYKIDDIWHAGINGRGGYINAGNALELVQAFRDILSAVAAAAGASSAAAASLNSGSLTAGSKVYQTTLDPADWSGDVRAYDISLGPDDGQSACSLPRGQLCGYPKNPGDPDDPAWTAADQLNALNYSSDRKIVTLAANATPPGIAFRWDSLTDSQKQALLGQEPLLADATGADLAEAQARLDYVRGERTNEQSDSGNPGTYAFRDRSTVLGDIIRSGALFVGPPNRFYTDNNYSQGDPDTDTSSFKSVHEDRTPVLYVGANDGMLHALNADTGAEIFAFVPNLVFERLADLSELDYEHQSYVDGLLSEGDAFYGEAWHTVLVGSTGLGAQGLFALEVTDPVPAENAAESDYTSTVLWEISDRDDPDLGYVFGKPAIVRIGTAANFKWVAVVGNGYNSMSADGEDPANCEADAPDGALCTISQTGDAVLFILDIESGGIIGKMNTGVGQDQDPTGAERGNGLAEVTVVDGNGDLYADFAYAGDLFGNLWKFDLTDVDSLDKSPVGMAPLFHTERDTNAGTAQPITTPVAVSPHPTGLGTIVLFGTGKFFAQSDVADTSVQTFYGVWDGPAGDCSVPPTMTRDDLIAQEFIVTEVEHQSGQTLARVASDPADGAQYAIDWESPTCEQRHRGWYIDLPEAGERVHAPPQTRLGRVVFTSVIPEADRCTAGAKSWVNALDARDGTRLSISPFDFNLDGAFDIAPGSETTDLVRVTGNDGDRYFVGSSLRIVGSDGSSSGVYSAPATLVLNESASMGYVATSEGELINLRESSALGWRVWQQAR